MKTLTTAEGWIIDARIRMKMAPSMKRILEYMEANPGKHGDNDLAKACFCDRGVAKKALNALREAGILGIAAYRRSGATPQALYGWAWKCGQEATPPPKLTDAEKQRSRRKKLREKFGDLSWRVHQSRSHGGADTLVIDGKVVYRRRKK